VFFLFCFFFFFFSLPSIHLVLSLSFCHRQGNRSPLFRQ
jgi:hypothetical protein